MNPTANAADRANRAAWDGRPGYYEIWFVVVFEPGARRAYWFRYTTMAPVAASSSPQAMVWAAAFDAGAESPAHAAKHIVDIAQYATEREPFFVRIGDTELAATGASGAVAADAGRIDWQLSFQSLAPHAPRTPQLLSALPLPVHAAHAHCEMRVDGQVIIDGNRRELVDAVGIQVHIHGSKRVESLRWCYVPRFDDDPRTALELTTAKLRERVAGVPVPAIGSLWLGGDPALQLTGLRHSRNIRARLLRPDLLRVDVRTRNRRAIIRAWTEPRAFVGYVYRDPDGSDIPVAQSDIASVHVETFERRGLGWRPLRTLHSRGGGALEVHGQRLPNVRYIEWDDSELSSSAGTREPEAPELAATPARIWSLGLTYRQHIAETGSAGEPPVVFEKHPRTWNPSAATVAVPHSRALVDALAALDPSAAARIEAELGYLPALMDYEVELGIVLREGCNVEELRRGELPALGYFLANDLSARSLQILGEGQANRLDYWSASKSFAGFLPVGPVVPSQTAELPSVVVRTRVNGQLRQECSTDDLILSLPGLLEHTCRRAGGALVAGAVILTGTPSGVALQVPAWKRKLGDKLLDRFGKLRAAISTYSGSDRFCGPGDVIEVDGGMLGARTVRLVC